jgi:hypothetical protein
MAVSWLYIPIHNHIIIYHNNIQTHHCMHNKKHEVPFESHFIDPSCLFSAPNGRTHLLDRKERMDHNLLGLPISEVPKRTTTDR